MERIRNCFLHYPTVNAAKLSGCHHFKQKVVSKTMASTSGISQNITSGVTDNSSVEHDTACLTLGHAGTLCFSVNFVCDGQSISSKEITRSSFPIEANKEHQQRSTNLLHLGTDLNAVVTSSAVENNPFYPFKKLGQVKFADALECGSTTGPIEESEPLRLWKEMKQNGFLSSSHGGMLMPKQQVCQPKRRKDDELKKKVELVKREKVIRNPVQKPVSQNRLTKLAAPSGLLSGLNPGIINHVRNSKQVHSIIEAIVRSEKLDCQSQHRITDQNARVNKEINDWKKDQSYDYDSAANQYGYSSKPYISHAVECRGEVNEMDTINHNFHQGASTTSCLITECEDDALTLKLSSATPLILENANSGSTDELCVNEESINTLSLKAATVASQWLGLLQHDIKGRLAALRRSKKRVRNVIHTELPYLLSTEFTSNKENGPYFAQSSESCSERANSEMHVARWRSLFNQMDKALCEEGKHLESWLKQVQQMQLHCENSLKLVGSEGLPNSGSSIGLRMKNSEALEMESAIRAAAASIYSTCNLIMTTENVSCF